MSAPLAVSDVADLRAYERERPEFLRQVLALKAARRIPLGPHVSLVFESRTTVRFQIQEMARVEKLATDEAIQGELDIYNPLIPDQFELSMTVFIELVSPEELRTWLPRLVGIESAIGVFLGEGNERKFVAAEPEGAHLAQLTRDDVTSSVHYLRVLLGPELGRRFLEETAGVVCMLDNYPCEQVLGPETKASIESDWSRLKNYFANSLHSLAGKAQ